MRRRHWLLPLLLLTAPQSGSVAQSQAAQSCLQKTALSQNVNFLWKSPAGTLKITSGTRKADLYLTAYNRAGQTLWQEQKVGFISSIQVVDGVLVMETSNNGIGAYITSHTALISPRLENPTWVWGVPLAAQPSAHAMLFSQESVNIPQEEDGMNFQRVRLRPDIAITSLHFAAPARKNCGKAQGFYDQFGQPKYEGHFIVVARKDRCGEFVTRYDWLK